MGHLKEYQAQDLSPCHEYRFANAVLKVAAPILSAEEKSTLETMIQTLHMALEDLAAGEHLSSLIEALDDFYDDRPILRDLGIAARIIELNEKKEPMDCKRIQHLMQQVFNVYASFEDKLIRRRAHAALTEYMEDNFTSYDRPTRHFDREVCL
jgi:hypothetical protein